MPISYPATFCEGLLTLEDSRARNGAMDFKVRIRPGFELAPSPLVRRLAALRPTLAEHSCTSDEMDGGHGPDGHPMTVPHLVEHLAIDLIVERRPAEAEGIPVAGYTVWLDRKDGLARVTLSSADHDATEQAVFEACNLIDVVSR